MPAHSFNRYGAISAIALGAAITLAYVSRPDGLGATLTRLQEKRQTRPIEGRLHPAGLWRPFASARSAIQSPMGADVVEAYVTLRRAVAENRTASTLLSAGAAELLAGDPHIANALLSEAAALAPESALVWNDLAVSYLAAPADSSIEATVRAYEAAATAGSLSADFTPALFNLGLAASRLGLREAEHTWERLLQIEPEPQWRAEIATRRASRRPVNAQSVAGIISRLRTADPRTLGSVAAEITALDPQAAREAAFEFLLPEWALASLRADHVAANHVMEFVQALARVLAEREKDPLLEDCLRVPAADIRSRGALARGMAAYGEGRRHQRLARFEQALNEFKVALASLRQLRGPTSGCAAIAQAALGHSLYQSDGPRESLAHLNAANETARARGYPSLTARTDWLLALAFVGIAEPAQAIAAYDRAMAMYARTGESANLCSVARASADLLRIQGEWVSGWPRLSLALRCAVDDTDPLRRYLVFFEASLFASDASLPRAALAFQEAALEAARDRKLEATIAEALIRRAMLKARVGDVTDARKDLALARQAAEGISSPGMSAYQRAWAARVDGELALQSAPDTVSMILDASVVDLFASLEPAEVPRIHLLRARALRRLGSTEAAERELMDGIRVIERHVSRLEREDQRLSYIDAEWDLVAELVQLRFERGQFADALVQAHHHAGEPPPFGRDLCRPRDDGAMVYAFISLPRELLLFACANNGLVARRIAESSSVIESRIQTYRRLLLDDAHRDDAAAAGEQLFELLFGWSRPAPGVRLLIIPDGVFGLLPYASLIDPATGRFLIEDHDVALLTAGGLQRGSRESRPDQAVVVAPAAGSPLPRADEEATRVAAEYERPVVLRGNNATAGALRRAVATARVVHFAGHAKANPRLPWASYLSVTPDAAHPQGRVEASEIASWPLSTADLVVLSACESVAPRSFRGDSLVGLAKAFLRAGSRFVVGSLWEVEDDSTSQLMPLFHAANRHTGDPIKALRDAQLRLLRSRDPSYRLPRSWAGFIAVTGERSPSRAP